MKSLFTLAALGAVSALFVPWPEALLNLVTKPAPAKVGPARVSLESQQTQPAPILSGAVAVKPGVYEITATRLIAPADGVVTARPGSLVFVATGLPRVMTTLPTGAIATNGTVKANQVLAESPAGKFTVSFFEGDGSLGQPSAALLQALQTGVQR